MVGAPSLSPQAMADVRAHLYDMKAGWQTEEQKRIRQRDSLRREAEKRLFRRLSLKAQMRLTACAVGGNA